MDASNADLQIAPKTRLNERLAAPAVHLHSSGRRRYDRRVDVLAACSMRVHPVPGREAVYRARSQG